MDSEAIGSLDGTCKVAEVLVCALTSELLAFTLDSLAPQSDTDSLDDKAVRRAEFDCPLLDFCFGERE